MQGWIKDYRQELDSAVWDMPPLYHRVWQWLKYQANHNDREIIMRDNSKLTIQRGQCLTSHRQIAEGVAWNERGLRRVPNPKTIKVILQWMKNEKMITLQNGNAQYTHVTLCNYSSFQGSDNDESNAKVTVDGEQSNGPWIQTRMIRIEKNEKKGTNPLTPQATTNDDQCPPLIVKPVKVKFAEFVVMTNDEHLSLVAKLGSEERFGRCVEILDNYKGANGKKYRSDYRAMLNWVITRLEEEEKKTYKNCGQPIPRAFSSLEEWATGKGDP